MSPQTPAEAPSQLFVPTPEGPPAPVVVSQPIAPAAAQHRLPIGLQIGVALLFLYLVLVYLDRRFLVIHRRSTKPVPPPTPDDAPDAGLDLVKEASSGTKR